MKPAWSGFHSTLPNPIECGRKFCTRCGRWRLVCDFAPDPRNQTSGLRARCRTCARIAQRRLMADATKRALRREYQRFWTEAQRRRAGIPPRNWRTPRPLPPGDEGSYLDAAPLVAELARWDGHQWALAELAGLPPRAIYRIESGEVEHVMLDTADRLALVLGRSITELWDDR